MSTLKTVLQRRLFSQARRSTRVTTHLSRASITSTASPISATKGGIFSNRLLSGGSNFHQHIPVRSFHRSMANRDLRLGDVAPDFSCDTTAGPINSFHEWVGKDNWVILFSHPADFTPVCTTELGMVEKLQPEFAKRNVKCIGLSCDPLDSHVSWIGDIVETQKLDGNGKYNGLSYPIIADDSRQVASKYHMLDQSNINNAGLPLTVRSVFIINGADMKIKLILTYPASTGRNFDEIIRVIDSLQLTEYQKVATPVNWRNGDECVIVPSVNDEDAKKLFPKGWTPVKPYLRLTPQPSKL